MEKQNRKPQQPKPLQPVSYYLARWARARRILESGNVTVIDPKHGDYAITLEEARDLRNTVIVNIFDGICECQPRKKYVGSSAAYGVFCEHLNAAFLYAESALDAVELVEEMVNQLSS